jgi:septal ring factor EnvC (AmiA/AmiB activator)
MENQNTHQNTHQNTAQKIIERIGELQRQLAEEREKLERARARCEHQWVREDNGDYHRPGYYYVCRVCKEVTTQRPKSYAAILPL